MMLLLERLDTNNCYKPEEESVYNVIQAKYAEMTSLFFLCLNLFVQFTGEFVVVAGVFFKSPQNAIVCLKLWVFVWRVITHSEKE